MRLDHVAQRAGLFVESAAALHADRLSRRNLYLPDVAPIPDRLEHSVGEAERQYVLNRLLAQVVIDAVDVVFVEDLVDLPVEIASARKVVAEWLLDDYAPPA